MSRLPSIKNAKRVANEALKCAEGRLAHAASHVPHDYLLLRWIASMVAVEAHAVWERYAERRLVIALCHSPTHLIAENGIRGLRSVSVGLAEVIVRGNGPFFNFRSFEELHGKASRLVGRPANPFTAVANDARQYVDTLASIRNYCVHHSDAAWVTYKRALAATYKIRSAPQPDEFLYSLDLRKGHPLMGRRRVDGLLSKVREAIAAT